MNSPPASRSARRGLPRPRRTLFDVADRHDHQAIAQAKLSAPPARPCDDCRAWLAGLPKPARPCGVVAGRYVPRRSCGRRTNRGRGHRPAGIAPPTGCAAYWRRAARSSRTEVIADAAAAGISCSTLCKARIALNVRLQRSRGRCAPHVAVVNPGLRNRNSITKIKSVRTAAKASGPGFERVTHFCYAPEGLLIVRLTESAHGFSCAC